MIKKEFRIKVLLGAIRRQIYGRLSCKCLERRKH